jgi:hypothetical protein
MPTPWVRGYCGRFNQCHVDAVIHGPKPIGAAAFTAAPLLPRIHVNPNRRHTMPKNVTRVEALRHSPLTISTMAVLFILMSLTLGLGISYLLLRAFLLLLS